PERVAPDRALRFATWSRHREIGALKWRAQRTTPLVAALALPLLPSVTARGIVLKPDPPAPPPAPSPTRDHRNQAFPAGTDCRTQISGAAPEGRDVHL